MSVPFGWTVSPRFSWILFAITVVSGMLVLQQWEEWSETESDLMIKQETLAGSHYDREAHELQNAVAFRECVIQDLVQHRITFDEAVKEFERIDRLNPIRFAKLQVVYQGNDLREDLTLQVMNYLEGYFGALKLGERKKKMLPYEAERRRYLSRS